MSILSFTPSFLRFITFFLPFTPFFQQCRNFNFFQFFLFAEQNLVNVVKESLSSLKIGQLAQQ